jgi:hypothetical protein
MGVRIMAKTYEQGLQDGHDSAIRYVLGYLNGVGDCGSTAYEEILAGCDKEQIIKSARKDGEMRFTGLDVYLRRERQHAKLMQPTQPAEGE